MSELELADCGVVPMPPEAARGQEQVRGDRVGPPDHAPAWPLLEAPVGRPYAQMGQVDDGLAALPAEAGEAGEEVHVFAHHQVASIAVQREERLPGAELRDALSASEEAAVELPRRDQEMSAGLRRFV